MKGDAPMKKPMIGLMVACITVPVLSGPAAAAAREEEGLSFSLGLSVLALMESYGQDVKAAFGPGLRVDIGLGRSLFLAPEASVGIGGWSLGGTLNFGLKRFFAGAGYLAAGFGGSWEEWGVNSLFKVHAGTRGRRATVAVSLVVNRWLKGFGLTAGYLF